MQSKLDYKLGLFDLKADRPSLYQLETTHSGGIDKRFYVKAKHHSGDQWIKARIITTRLAKSTASFIKFIWICSCFFVLDADCDTLKPKTPDSYEYYIHFEDTDKRNDCWIPFQKIKLTEEQVLDTKPEENAIANLHPNDNPHYGLNAAELAMH